MWLHLTLRTRKSRKGKEATDVISRNMSLVCSNPSSPAYYLFNLTPQFPQNGIYETTYLSGVGLRINNITDINL